MDWDFSPPVSSGMGDHDVTVDGTHLKGKRVALMITGGIAAMKAPFIVRALRRQCADVAVFASDEALRYTTVDALEWCSGNSVITRLTSAAEHISDANPFDIFLVAPATYNTINKMACGIADNALTTTLGSALGRMERGDASVLVAPTMHGTLHNSILTESLKKLHSMGVRIIPPREDYGKHNIPSEETLVAEVCRASSKSKLKGIKVLVTGGPTPVPIDNARRITNKFTGRLGSEIAAELFMRGADVTLIHGGTAYNPPSYLNKKNVKSYDEYRTQVNSILADKKFAFGIFSAAVADYMPEKVAEGKIPSGVLKSIDLVPTVKVIDEVREKFPKLKMLSFKYQERISHDELISIAKDRLEKGNIAVIANRGEETEVNGDQVAWLVSKNMEPYKLSSKKGIAIGIADFMENNI